MKIELFSGFQSDFGFQSEWLFVEYTQNKNCKFKLLFITFFPEILEKPALLATISQNIGLNEKFDVQNSIIV
jgi:hypothetical protein